jgi:hypothetical protein
MKQINLFAIAGALAALIMPVLASAAPVWTSTACSSNTVQQHAKTCASSGSPTSYQATVSAWSANTGANFATALLNPYSEGFGVSAQGESTGSPQHALDNSAGTDAILVNFGTNRVALNYLSTGWVNTDADVSILRYTGAAAPLLGNYSISNLLASGGWEMVGNYNSLSTAQALSFNTGANAKSASWWLISAFDSRYTNGTALGNADANDDYLKLKSFGGNVVANVPEPSTWMLFGVAMIGLLAGRRKAHAK